MKTMTYAKLHELLEPHKFDKARAKKTNNNMRGATALARYVKGTGEALIRLSEEINDEGFIQKHEDLLSEIGSDLLFEAKIYAFRSCVKENENTDGSYEPPLNPKPDPNVLVASVRFG